MKVQTTNKHLFCLQRTFILKPALQTGEDRIVLQLGIAAQIQGKRIKLAFIKRKVIQTRIN